MTEIDADVVVVTRPECGATSSVRAGRRMASDFCPSCDYPLFWARPQSIEAPESRSDDARWRAPGASGSAVHATLACPQCAELNLPTAVVCVRCGAPMTPPAPVPEPPPPAPVIVMQAPDEVVVLCQHRRTWWVVAVTAAVTIPLTLILVWLF